MSILQRTVGVLAAGVVLVVAIMVLVARQKDERPPFEVTRVDVTRGTISRRVMATGTVQPARTVEVGAQVSGTLQSIEADFNQPVRARQVIARLDPSTYQSQLAEAQARLQQAQGERERRRVAVDDANARLARTESLSRGSLVPQAELDLARTTAKQAAAELKAAEAAVDGTRALITEAQVSLNHTIIRSPINGIIVSRHVDVGQTVAAAVQTPVLFTVADLRRMQLLAEIAEGDVGGVRPGSRVTFRIESIGEQEFEGMVSAVRLQPLVEQAAASTSGSGGTAQATVGTSGTPGPSAASPAPTATSAPAAGTATTPRGASGAQPTTSQPPSSSSSSSSTATPPAASTAPTPAGRGVVTYTAVVDVDNVKGAMPPGATAILELGGSERHDVIRIPNNAVTFRPSEATFAAIDQEPPLLEAPRVPRRRSLDATRGGYVWKFENGRFVPIVVELGIADDSWTELVRGDIQPGDMLVTRVQEFKGSRVQ
jgi:HlyD family secretion protein